MEKEKLAFETNPYKGHKLKVWYLKDPNGGDAIVELYKENNLLREFIYPAYKIWNLSAHFSDIVDGEIENSAEGYLEAGADGLGGVVMPRPHPNK